MFNFTAHFFESKIYINKGFAYHCNEFLTELLQNDFSNKFLDNYKYLTQNYKALKIYSSIQKVDFFEFNRNIIACQQAMNILDSVFDKISISKHISSAGEVTTNSLFDLLNTLSYLWGDDSDVDLDSDYFQEDDIEPYFMNFYPTGLQFAIEDSDAMAEIENLNSKIETLCTDYLTFAEDILRVEYLYRRFVDEYLHSSNKFLDSEALGDVFVKFLTDIEKDHYQNYMNFKSGNSRLFHEVIRIDGKNVLCEAYHFQSLGAFLYFDLFRGVYSHYLPKKCENCNQYFLMKSGKYTNYCQRPLTDDKTKTCRDIGSNQRYLDKCKTDPIWQHTTEHTRRTTPDT